MFVYVVNCFKTEKQKCNFSYVRRISRSLGPALGAGVGLCFYMVTGLKNMRHKTWNDPHTFIQ